AGLHIGNAVSLRPVDLEIMNDGDADSGHVEPVHELFYRQRSEAVRPEVGLRSFDRRDVAGYRGLLGSRGTADRYDRKSEDDRRNLAHVISPGAGEIHSATGKNSQAVF